LRISVVQLDPAAEMTGPSTLGAIAQETDSSAAAAQPPMTSRRLCIWYFMIFGSDEFQVGCPA
jgi:hypothetical protein